jgi:hypothetical protein
MTGPGRMVLRGALFSLALAGLRVPAALARDSVEDLVARVSPDSIRSCMQTLQDFGTRYALAATRDSVASWILERLRRPGISAAEADSFFQEGIWNRNIIATIPGTGSSLEYVVLGAHYDSYAWDGGGPLVQAPGADDNASGAAAVMEVARVLAASGWRPRRTIRFAAFAAEELGLWGSAHYAREAAQAGDRIVLMLNNDMVGQNTRPPGEWSVKLDYYARSLHLRDFSRQLAREYTTLQTAPGPVNLVVDSYPFYDFGYPVIGYEEGETSRHYHQSTDLVAFCDPDFVAEVARLDCALVVRMAENPAFVTDLTLTDLGDGHSLRVSWANSEDADFRGYLLGIGTGPGEYGQSLSLAAKEHTFTGLHSGRRYYAGVSVENEGAFAGMVVEQNVLLKASPDVLSLKLDGPEPFRSGATFSYYLPQEGIVSLRIFDLAGGSVRTLAPGGSGPGIHSVSWDARRDDGRELSSGVYFCRLASGSEARTIRCVLIR